MLLRRGYATAPEAFTKTSLKALKSRLDTIPTLDPHSPPPHTVLSLRRPRESAILVPLLNIKGKAYVMMQLRAANMRVHASEAG